jgi:hypothetical protein
MDHVRILKTVELSQSTPFKSEPDGDAIKVISRLYSVAACALVSNFSG